MDESRLSVFPALPPGGKYELVLGGAEHSAFTDHALLGEKRPAKSQSPSGHSRPVHGLSRRLAVRRSCGQGLA
jgi:hypothetical protein